jgi:hypothetical protein
MKTHSKIIKKCLFVAGTIEIIMGLAHFSLPGLIYKSEGFQHLNSVETDIVTLCTLSVGILLIAVGFISILCAKKYDMYKEIALNITTINLLLWLVRIIFEIVLPIKITILSVKNPTLYAMPVFIVLWIVIASAVLFMWTDKQKSQYSETSYPRS